MPPSAVAKLAAVSTLKEEERVELMRRVRVGSISVDEAVALATIGASPERRKSSSPSVRPHSIDGSALLPAGLSGGQWKEMTVALDGTTLRFSHLEHESVTIALNAEVTVANLNDVPHDGVQSICVSVPGQKDMYFFTERPEETMAWKQSIETAVTRSSIVGGNGDGDDGDGDDHVTADAVADDALVSDVKGDDSQPTPPETDTTTGYGGSSVSPKDKTQLPNTDVRENPLGNSSSEEEDDNHASGGDGGGASSATVAGASDDDAVEEEEEEVFTPVRISQSPTGSENATSPPPPPSRDGDGVVDTEQGRNDDDKTAAADPWETVSPSFEGQRISSHRSFRDRVSFSRADSQTSFRGVSVSAPGVEMVVPEYDEDAERAAAVAKMVGEENPIVVRDECDERVGSTRLCSC